MIFSPSFFSPFSTMQYSTLFTGISVFLGFGRKESLDQISLCLLGEITIVFASLGKYVNHFPGKYLGKPDYRIYIMYPFPSF